MSSAFSLIFAMSLAIEHGNIGEQNENRHVIEPFLVPDQGFGDPPGDLNDPEDDRQDDPIPDPLGVDDIRERRRIRQENAGVSTVPNPLKLISVNLEEDLTWKQFRLERLQHRLREMQSDGTFGDERQQEMLLTEIRQLKSALRLPIVAEDAQIIHPPTDAKPTASIHRDTHDAGEEHGLGGPVGVVAAVFIGAVATGYILMKCSRAIRKKKIPFALGPGRL
jgi:hypothetical protein